MSSFYCEHCGNACCDSPDGYITGCQHYPPDTANFRTLLWQLAHVVKDRKEFILSPLPSYNQKSLLDLWNAGLYDECDAIVYCLASGDTY